jgi:hypothetical protein
MELCFQDFCNIFDGEAEGNLLKASILALGNSIQKTNEKTIIGILNELTHNIEYISI